ncbi:FUSC family protein [Pseudomonas paraeruginosa]|uniref:FUSC family protein n=1 Tax=Pseudomonas aeruginosa TaxID=287 RepID=UPI0021F84F3F|nr:FUSC family protein [Pseudomonas aeruginosa]UYT21661.1 fusaric acid resistance protein [Pseudomonas aeruginosa]
MAASALRARGWHAALPLPWDAHSLGYVLRSIGAAALALGLGLYLQLDAPFSAASTVLLLVNPVQGAVVGKGWWRAVGTLAGALAAFVLSALFAQKMLLFVIALGFWLGLCVGVMSLVRHFYATAAVVAGYTVCLALGPAMVEPGLAFGHIVTRASAVIVGVCSLSLVTVLFSRRTMLQRLRDRLGRLCAAALELLAARCVGALDEAQESRWRGLVGEVYALDDLLGVGRAESRRLNAAVAAIRGGLAALFATLMEFRLAGEAERDLARPLAGELRVLGAGLERGEADFAGAALRIEALRERLAASARRLPAEDLRACREALQLERLGDQLADLGVALRGFARLDGHPPAHERPVAFHRHYREALRNGARAWLAMLIGAAAWFLSGWDQGPTLLAVLGPYCTLLAASAFPAEGTRNFIRGTLYAIPAALFCKFLLLPLVNGFPLLVLCLGFFWSFGIQATTVPRRALQGIAYLIAFNTLVATDNVARFDFIDFANQSCAWVLALCISLLVYRLLPKDLARHSTVLLDYLHRETLALLRGRRRFDAQAWQSRQQHRIAQLGALHGADHPQARQALRQGFLSLQLGRELQRLRGARSTAAPGSAEALAIAGGLAGIAAAHRLPARAARHARRAARRLASLGAQRDSLLFTDLAWLLQAYAQAASAGGAPCEGETP